MKFHLVGGRVVDPSNREDMIRDVFVEDGFVVERPASTDGFVRVECAGLTVSPGFVELHGCMPDPIDESRAAVAGGFTTVLLSPANPTPIERPAIARDLAARAASARCHVEIAGALTTGLKGEEIADVGLLAGSGCRVLSNGTTPVRSARVLRHLLEYAGRFHRPILLRAADAELELGGVVREGPRAAWLGLPYVPPEAEEIGVTTAAALVRRTATPVHLTHLWSRRGVDALRRARAEGLPLTGSTTAHHLWLGDEVIDETAYAGVCRFVPPLGDEDDRKALREGLRDGTLLGVASDHRPVPLELQDRELELAAPGQLGFETALPLALAALDGDVAAAVQALSIGPASVIGVDATVRVGAPANLTVFDPAAEWTVGPDTLASRVGGSPLAGRTVRGSVAMTFVGGRLVHESG